MDNVLVFSFAENNVFYAREEMDLSSLKITTLEKSKPIMLVCRSQAYCAYLFEKFFKSRKITGYANINKIKQDIYEVSIFLHVIVDPPRELGERDRYFLHGIADLLSFPNNGRVAQSIYGISSSVEKEHLEYVIGDIDNPGIIQVGLAAEDQPGFMVTIPDGMKLVDIEEMSKQPTSEFLKYVLTLPS